MEVYTHSHAPLFLRCWYPFDLTIAFKSTKMELGPRKLCRWPLVYESWVGSIVHGLLAHH